MIKFVLKYPTAKDLKLAKQEELRQTMIESGAKQIATKESEALAEVTAKSITIDVPHLVGRQNWIIEEALRIEESIKGIDNHIQELLHGNTSKDIKTHPYTELLYSSPFIKKQNRLIPTLALFSMKKYYPSLPIGYDICCCL
ncbi:hypothetical protein KZZ19_027180 (plasmid) [Bacillus thuringiensis]|nr:hypothetical protein [Bacillus thuringiensis]